MIRSTPPSSPPGAPDAATFELELELFLEAVFRRYQHDFRRYSRPTLRRRMSQALAALRCESLSMLQHRLLRDPALFATVLSYLTVQVSDLFRDPEYHRALRQLVMPALHGHASLKIWVAGCGTGEEVYSLAILLEEEGLLDRSVIYATDVSREALRAAEAGVYALDRAQAFSRNYQLAGGRRALSDYYSGGHQSIAFDERLRQKAVFYDHSLATGDVFAEVQLVTCRNVLIYFEADLRERALSLFHASLVPKGFLALGSKETLRSSVYRERFTDVDREHRLFERV